MTISDLDTIAPFDTERFGGDRTRLLRVLLDTFPGRAFVVPGRGFLVAQHDAIGPFVADDADARNALLAAAFALPWSVAPKMIVPPDSDHLAAIRATGMRETRALRHQRLHLDVLAGKRSSLVAQTSFGEG